MKSLARSARRVQDDGGSFLPLGLRPLEDMKIRARRGTATFVAGPPGAMKTGLVLYLILRMNLPTIYMSADAEDFEIVERAAAMMSGDTMEQVRANPAKYISLLESRSNVKFVYDDAPSYEDLEMEVSAYAEIYGRFPEVIVIDNLMNLTGENESEWAAHRDHARVIHRLTRITKAALFVLAHMSDDRVDPTTPAPRKSLMGKVGALPKAIWSVALDGDVLKVSPVKNRWGPADASGKTYARVFCDPARNQLFQSDYDMRNGVPA
jgi:hypothetical protein